MLEHLPGWLGGMLRNFRAGHSKLMIVQPEIGVGNTVIDLSSPAFAYGARLPVRFTADGEGVSPPLVWNSVLTSDPVLTWVRRVIGETAKATMDIGSVA